MIKGVVAVGERRKRPEKQKKGKKERGGREKRVGAKGQSCWSTFRPRAKARCARRAINGALVRVLKACCCCCFKNLEVSTRNSDDYPNLKENFKH